MSPTDKTEQAAATHYRGSTLYIEDMPVRELAERFGTPLYAYSENTLRSQYARLSKSMGRIAPNLLICYALKANSNPALCRILAELGAGADVVSGGEVFLALHAGFPPERIVFAGVGKTRREIAEGLQAGVRHFHVESAGELKAIAETAHEMGKVAPIAVRVNPDVEAHTHPYITTGTRANKFGVSISEAYSLVKEAADTHSLKPLGLHAHVGSQLPEVGPIIEAARRLLELWDRLASEGIRLRELDIGGGLGIRYRPEDNPEGPEALASALAPLLAGRDIELVLEPGRFIAGPAGALITRVTYIKGEHTEGETSSETDRLAVVDAGMNDLLRPALYGAWHPVYPAEQATGQETHTYSIVGPVCESSDVLAKGRDMEALAPGDLLTIGQAGAYGYSMSSQYNARPRPAEVLVSGKEVRLIRERETYTDLLGRWLV